MPTINPNLVPSITAGSLFEAFSDDPTLDIRWLEATDPVYFSVFNRPLADIALRGYILAKSVDSLSIGVGRQSLFPFVIRPKFINGISSVNLPITLIWDINISGPSSWHSFRLLRVRRMTGGDDSAGQTGVLRFVFGAVSGNASQPSAILYADYEIDSPLSYQLVTMNPVMSLLETDRLTGSGINDFSGSITFRTMSTSNSEFDVMLQLLEPNQSLADPDTFGVYQNPPTLIVAASPAGNNVLEDISDIALNNGSGMMLDSVYNSIPPISSSVGSWSTAFNYPFDVEASRTSTGIPSITVPQNLFDEFVVTAPGGDRPSTQDNRQYNPVWLSSISTGSDTLTFILSTLPTTLGNVNPNPVEFAQFTISRSAVEGQIIDITPIGNLKAEIGTDSELFNQEFGVGHVRLSSLWGLSSGIVDDWYDQILGASITELEFTEGATRLSSFAVHRSSSYTPTLGQALALTGSSSDRTTPIHPSEENKFVTQKDEGAGDQLDLEALPGIGITAGISRYGYKGGVVHRAVKLEVDYQAINQQSPTFYNDHILPRLRALFGRDPIDFDVWWDGTRIKTRIGDKWIG